MMGLGLLRPAAMALVIVCDTALGIDRQRHNVSGGAGCCLASCL